MRKINIFVFCAFLATGAAFVAGFAFDLGRLVPAASFVGWFLCAYSGIAYLVASSLYLSRGSDNFWSTLYPANFGLALFAVAAFSNLDERALAFMAASCLAGAALSYLGSRARILGYRPIPIGILVVLVLLVFVEPIQGILKYVIVATAAFMLAGSALALAESNRGSRIVG
jgi:hypothetical protein